MRFKYLLITLSVILSVGIALSAVQTSLAAALNNPGHPWSQMDCDTYLCVDWQNKKIGAGVLSSPYNPFYFLDFRAGANDAILNLKQETSNLWNGIRMARLGTGQGTEAWFIGMSNADNILRIRGTGTDYMTINTSGSVGITATGNPGLTVGNGLIGYLKIGGSTIYDNAGDLTIDSDSNVTYTPDSLRVGGLASCVNVKTDGSGNLSCNTASYLTSYTESDPQVNALTSGKWCTSDGSYVNCTTNAPVTAESDPQVNSLTNGKWCTSDGTYVNCTSDAPGGVTGSGSTNYISKWSGGTSLTNSIIQDNGTNVGIGVAPNSYKLNVYGDIYANGWIRTAGSAGWYSESYAGGWYMSDSSWVRSYNNKSVVTSGEMQATTVRGNSYVCIGNDCRSYWPTSGITSELDPQVGAVTNGSWCKGDGGAVQCSYGAPGLTIYSQTAQNQTGTTDGARATLLIGTPNVLVLGGICQGWDHYDYSTNYRGVLPFGTNDEGWRFDQNNTWSTSMQEVSHSWKLFTCAQASDNYTRCVCGQQELNSASMTIYYIIR